MDRAGRVYFSTLEQIWRWEPGGRLSVVVPHTHTHVLVLDADGSLRGEHVGFDASTQRWSSKEWRLSGDGKLTELPSATESARFLAAIGAEGTRYYAVVDNNRRDVSRIERQRPGAAVEPVAGGTYGYRDGVGEAARFGPIGALAAGTDGSLYVTNAPSMRKVDAQRRVSTLARGGPLLKATPPSRFFTGRFGLLMGLAVDASGAVYIANYGGRRLIRIAPGGPASTLLRSELPWGPTGVALARGEIYVPEWGTLPRSWRSVRVRRRGADGRVETLAVVR